MANEPKLKPHKITKPIQLLAAWLAGLVLVDFLFLAAAATIDDPAWIRSMLTIAAVVNVPVFLVAIFLLQTKFRPEMQEDPYYHQYLNSKTGNSPIEPAPDALVEWASTDRSNPASEGTEGVKGKRASYGIKKIQKWGNSKIAVNKTRDDFVEILALLKEHGIPFSETFGNVRRDPPSHFQIAVGANVEFADLKNVVLAFANFKEGRINFINPYEEPEDLGDHILIGSYGTKFGPRLVNAQQILEKDLMSDQEFLDFIRQGGAI